MKHRRITNEIPQDGTGSPQTGEPVFLAVGKLRRPHGVKGEMLMEIITDFPERLRQNRTVFVGDQHEPLVIQSVRPQDRALLLSFAGLEDCDMVGRLRNLVVYIKSDELPKLPEGEYYYHELLNLKVIDENGHDLGVLTEILETGANDVYVVRQSEGDELLLPVIEGVILEVDLEHQVMRVRPPEWG